MKKQTEQLVNDSTPKNWQSFDTCCLDVSLFNRYQKDLYLLATLSWINDRFSRCIINFGDTLHRHNLLEECHSMEAAHQKAHELGNEWLHKNKPLLEELTIPYDIIRNDFWLEHSDFMNTHSALWNFYQTDTTFNTIVNDDIEKFVSRQKDKDADFVRQASLSYLLEETAADILIGKQGGVAHLYPGSRFNCYWYLAGNADKIPSALQGLENSAFKRLSPSHIMRSYASSHAHRLTTNNDNKYPASYISA